MNNLFKYIVAAFVLIIMGAIIVVQFLPKPKLSFTERQNINLAIQKLNSELPHLKKLHFVMIHLLIIMLYMAEKKLMSFTKKILMKSVS